MNVVDYRHESSQKIHIATRRKRKKKNFTKLLFFFLANLEEKQKYKNFKIHEIRAKIKIRPTSARIYGGGREQRQNVARGEDCPVVADLQNYSALL